VGLVVEKALTTEELLAYGYARCVVAMEEHLDSEGYTGYLLSMAGSALAHLSKDTIRMTVLYTDGPLIELMADCDQPMKTSVTTPAGKVFEIFRTAANSKIHTDLKGNLYYEAPVERFRAMAIKLMLHPGHYDQTLAPKPPEPDRGEHYGSW